MAQATKCTGACDRTLQELDEEGIEVLESIVINCKNHEGICRECADILRDELEPRDFDSIHPNETVEDFLSHEG